MRVVLLLLLLGGAARAEGDVWKWRAPDTLEVASLSVAVGLIWVDVLQTREWAANRCAISPTSTGTVLPACDWRSYTEINPFLGRNPSPTNVVLVGGVLSSAVLVASWYILPPKWRLIPVGAVIVGESYFITRNHINGWRISF